MYQATSNPALNSRPQLLIEWLTASLRRQLASYACLTGIAQQRPADADIPPVKGHTLRADQIGPDIDATTRRDFGLPVDHRVRDWGTEFDAWSR